ncbi:hypothetical protein EJV47_11020 [Hymenobacter gummosus]|uniref:Uncharacterized protein n=1 Tax=Hymenobacter gummosus TaxID=1776032 RepID=A0A3S0IP11_9BACT|nr:hypothetical protein [Hymenobacter gummosus]RTQ50159.1 hypothetical protein EJV47_11020 [Hymenobacter gummosus]
MHQNLTPAQRQLSDYLSGISQRCFHGAEWIMNVEYVAWDALSSGPRSFGWSRITAEDTQELRRLARAAGAWLLFDEVTRETAVPLAQWPAVFEEAQRRNRELLDE